MSESDVFIIKSEQPKLTAATIDSYVGPYCGDVYLTALDLFPSFKLLKQASVYLKDDMDFISGGLDTYGNPGVWIGQEEGTLTTRMKSRVVERFGLVEEFLDMPDSAFMPFVLAHEIVHVLQEDPEFVNYFGTASDELIDGFVDYEGYVNSDMELNGDYIAAIIVGNSNFGIDLGFMPPDHEPMGWKKWADEHPIPKTISMKS